MSVERRDVSEAVTVVVSGEIDPGNAVELRLAIVAAIADPAPDRPIVVDLTHLRYIDSAGIAALLHGRRAAAAAGRSFRVTGPTGNVLEVLQLCGVWPMLAEVTR